MRIITVHKISDLLLKSVDCFSNLPSLESSKELQSCKVTTLFPFFDNLSPPSLNRFDLLDNLEPLFSRSFSLKPSFNAFDNNFCCKDLLEFSLSLISAFLLSLLLLKKPLVEEVSLKDSLDLFGSNFASEGLYLILTVFNPIN